MMAKAEITTERVDDLPLLLAQLHKMGLAEVIDGQIKPHWHRQGLSIGQTTTVWLGFILSESDHRLSYVEPWASRIPATLKQLVDPQVTARDFTDDRLGDVLRYLSDDEDWAAIEQALGARLIRVYRLPTETVRLDSSSVAVHHDPEGTELIRYGHSKDRRPDLAQVKVMLATLDPLGAPLVTQVVAGNRADDGLYRPAIDQVRQVVGQSGLLYLGDSKMEALETRVHLTAGGDYYLTPLSKKGEQAELLAELVRPVLAGEQPLEEVLPAAPETEEPPQPIASGYETHRRQATLLDGEQIDWQERLLVVYSPALAASADKGLQRRLRRAETKLLALTPPPGRGKRQYAELAPLQAAVAAILERHRVADLLQVSYAKQVSRREVRQYQDRPARTEEKVRYQLQVSRQAEAIQAHQRTLGWRLYVTNAPPEQLSLAQAVRAYRGAPRIERNFARLKGRPLGLRPAYLQREDHLTGLVRLLSLALSVLTLTEFVARRKLETQAEGLAGLYPGNPKQQTQRPTTERLLSAFKEITLSRVVLADQTIVHITPLTPLQSRILELLDFSASIYIDLAVEVLPNPP